MSCGPNVPRTLPMGTPGSTPQPNRLVLVVGTWTEIESPGSVFVCPMECQAGRIFIAPGKRPTASTLAEAKAQAVEQQYGAYLNCPGKWYVGYFGASGNLPVTVVPMCCEPPKAFIQPTAEAFDDAWLGTVKGENFVLTNPTPGTPLAGGTSFVATTPMLLWSQSAQINKCLRSITLCQNGVLAGGTITTVLVVDSAARFSAGGTALTPRNLNTKSALTTTWTDVGHGMTASAAGAGTRTVGIWTSPPSLGGILDLQFEDGVHVGETGSLLLYSFAAVQAPSYEFVAQWREYPG